MPMITRTLNRFFRDKPVQNLAVYGVGQAFNLITPLLVIPYIISVCGLANYGKAAIGMAMVFFLMVFVDYGSDISGVRAVSTNRENPVAIRKIAVTTFTAKFLLLLVILALISILFVTVPYFRHESKLFFLGLPILVGQFLNPTWFLQGIENFKQITLVNILSKLVYLGGVLCCVTEPSDFIYINLWWGIGMITANGISFLYIVKCFNLQFSEVRKSDVKEHIVTGFPIFSSQIFVAMQLYSPLILIGFLTNGALAGAYRVVDQVIVIFKTYLLLFFNFAFPRVCYLLGGNPADGTRFWLLYNGGNFIFIVMAMTGVFCFADEIVNYFHPGDPVVIVRLLRIAVWIPLVMAVSVPLKQLVLGFSFNRFYVNVTIALALLNVFAIAIILPIMGIEGVIYCLISIEVVTIILFYLKIKNRLFLAR